MEKTCQRCQTNFTCQPENIANCSCSQFQLTTATHVYLKKTKYDCLCTSCLQTLNKLVTKSQQQPLPSPTALQQGTHYYMENGFLVFTEFYHLSRGYCCGSGCRHCAYGFQKS